MNHADDAITIKPINTKQLFRCNFSQFANSDVAFYRPNQHPDNGPATLSTHANFSMYTQENRLSDDCQLNDNRFGHSNNTGHIPPPPPLPNYNQANQTGQNHHSLLLNNTYTIKRELRNNHHFLAQSDNNGSNEPSSLNFISEHQNNQTMKVIKKKININKPHCQQVKANTVISRFKNNNLTNMTNLAPINNLNCRQAATGMRSSTENPDDHVDNSLTDFQSYPIQQNDLQSPQSNDFFSLPYHQTNCNQYNGQETCVKQPQQSHASLTMDRPNFNQRNYVNSNCHTSNQKRPSTSFLATSQQQTQGQLNQSAENYNSSNVQSNSIEDLRNEAPSKQQQQIDERTLQPLTLISALHSSLSSEKQRLYKEQLRNELAMKLKMKNHFQSQSSNLGVYLHKKKPKYNFFSQLYFLFHISFTLCLYKVSEIDKENQKIYEEVLNFYLGYLLATAIMFLLLQMCCKNVNLNCNKELRSQNTSIVSFGCISLGLIQLITIGLDLVNCMNNELIFLPVLQFVFVFLLMHFILTQTKESQKYFYNNVSLAHLLLTQISIWLNYFRQRRSNCGYFQTSVSRLPPVKFYTKPEASLVDENLLSLNETLVDETERISTILINKLNSTIDTQNPESLRNSKNNPIESPIQIATGTGNQFTTNASSFGDLLIPIIHHFQILAIFILISIWINNNKTKVNYQRTRLCEPESINCFNESEFVSSSFLNSPSKLKSIKGLFLGFLVISTTIIVLTTGNDYFLIATHSTIQMICVLLTVFALMMKGRKRKGLQKLPQIINLQEFHLFVIISLITTYYCSFSAIILNLTQKVIVFENLIDSLLLTIHITLQTLLLRSDGRKLEKLRDVHAFLIFANFSLWILEITEVASINGTNSSNLFNLNVLPQIIVSLNRFYSSLICIHFWKAK